MNKFDLEKENRNFLKKSCLIVAHPDDEILWFSSIISKVDLVIICFLGNPAFPDRGAARSRVLDNYPLSNIKCMNLDVPLNRQWSSGDNLIENEFGLELPAEAVARYKDSYFQLSQLLSKEITKYKNVFTHNPWGEYGHEMHVQLHKVVKDISEKNNFNVWFSNYVSNNTLSLAEQYIHQAPVGSVTLDTNIQLSDVVRDMYIAENCWTVSAHHNWAVNESFSRCVNKNDKLSQGRKVFSFNHLVW